MKMTAALIRKLLRLAEGELVPESSLKGDWFDRMKEDGILLTVSNGSRKRLRVSDANTFRSYLESQFDIRDLEETLHIMEREECDRTSQVSVTGDSKFRQHRTFSGFLVNSYQPIPAKLNGQALTILPPEGSFLFISDYKTFSIPDDVVIVGIENAENFCRIHQQRHFFEHHFSTFTPLLFVSRYPQSQHGDLIDWLQNIPNRYVHFGDLDLAGIAIYLNEFYRYLGERSNFIIPIDYEQRIANGNAERYNSQLHQYKNMRITDDRIAMLIKCIHRYHRGYDQEGFIGTSSTFPEEIR